MKMRLGTRSVDGVWFDIENMSEWRGGTYIQGD